MEFDKHSTELKFFLNKSKLNEFQLLLVNFNLSRDDQTLNFTYKHFFLYLLLL